MPNEAFCEATLYIDDIHIQIQFLYRKVTHTFSWNSQVVGIVCHLQTNGIPIHSTPAKMLLIAHRQSGGVCDMRHRHKNT